MWSCSACRFAAFLGIHRQAALGLVCWPKRVLSPQVKQDSPTARSIFVVSKVGKQPTGENKLLGDVFRSKPPTLGRCNWTRFRPNGSPPRYMALPWGPGHKHQTQDGPLPGKPGKRRDRQVAKKHKSIHLRVSGTSTILRLRVVDVHFKVFWHSKLFLSTLLEHVLPWDLWFPFRDWASIQPSCGSCQSLVKEAFLSQPPCSLSSRQVTDLFIVDLHEGNLGQRARAVKSALYGVLGSATCKQRCFVLSCLWNPDEERPNKPNHS